MPRTLSLYATPLFAPDDDATVADASAGTTTDPAPASTGGGSSKSQTGPSQEGIEEMRAEMEALKKKSQAMANYFNGVGDHEENMREALTAAGWSKTQIEEALQAHRDGQLAEEEEEEPQPRKRTGKGKKAPSSDEGEDEEDDRIAAVAAAQQEERLKRLNRELEEQVVSAIDNSEEVGIFLKRYAKEDDKDFKKRVGEAKKTFKKEVRQETLRLLQERRVRNNGRFQEEWMEEAAAKAAKAVASRMRSVIGDPSRLTGSSETVSASDMFVGKKPVEAPSWKEGMSVGEASGKVREFAVDSLLRGVTGEGESKV